ncbi:acetyl-coenzyme A thioesterase-like [Halichondria panicea]|uniref:acetyl-coenzyme A thioesterase-like n=1 Tax=Halichondria panicea TaxID=6063 RepID=UPI00312B7BDE
MLQMSTENEDRGPHWALKKVPTKRLLPNPTSVEVHEWVMPSCCFQHEQQFLRHGHLLRWMDVAACLSAEKHARVPCVTVSIDDIIFNSSVSVGHVVILKALVNRSFTSSLEVDVRVKSENPITGAQQDVCNALFVFVARPKDGSKVKLPPVAIETEEETKEHLLAGERRRKRVTYAKDLEQLLTNIQRFKITTTRRDSSADIKKISVSSTCVHTVQIVLPVHANHHGTTFGGQIMEWMTDIATISALRLCRAAVTLEGIQSVIFRGPSHVGERVSLKSSVNKVFSNNRFEVGVRVEGYDVGGEPRHINSAFYIFRADQGDLIIPEPVIESKVEEDRAGLALARHCLWLDRKAIQYDKSEVALNPENVYDLIYKSTSKLMTNYVRNYWEIVQTEQTFEFCKFQEKENLIVKVSDNLSGVTASVVYEKLANFKNRSKWDFLCKHIKVVKPVSEDDFVIHLVYKTLEHEAKELPKDFVLLASKRKTQGKNGETIYMLAFTSVTTEDLPPLRNYQRSTVLSSGYILEDSSLSPSSPSCKLTYVHQLGSSTMPFFARDLVGVSSLLQKLYLSLRAFIFS